MKNKYLLGVISFILLFPFRLPVNVLMIKVLSFIAQMEGTKLPIDMLMWNVAITKVLYNTIFISLLLKSFYNVLTDDWEWDYSNAQPLTGITGFILSIYLIYDCISAYDLTKFILTL